MLLRVRMLISACSRAANPFFQPPRLRPVLVGSSPYLASLDCFCNGQYVTTVQADGLIIATPTGIHFSAPPSLLISPSVPKALFSFSLVLSLSSLLFLHHVSTYGRRACTGACFFSDFLYPNLSLTHQERD